MLKILRIEKATKEVINDYEVRENENIVIEDGILYLMTDKEYEMYVSGEIEDYEINEPSFETEKNEVFKIVVE